MGASDCGIHLASLSISTNTTIHCYRSFTYVMLLFPSSPWRQRAQVSLILLDLFASLYSNNILHVEPCPRMSHNYSGTQSSCCSTFMASRNSDEIGEWRRWSYQRFEWVPYVIYFPFFPRAPRRPDVKIYSARNPFSLPCCIHVATAHCAKVWELSCYTVFVRCTHKGQCLGAKEKSFDAQLHSVPIIAHCLDNLRDSTPYGSPTGQPRNIGLAEVDDSGRGINASGCCIHAKETH